MNGPEQQTGGTWQPQYDQYVQEQQHQQHQQHGRFEGYPQGQQVASYGQQPLVVVPARTPGLAVLFSFLWLGAGNCYAGQTALGVTLIIAQVFCLPISYFLAAATFGVSSFFTIPLWLLAFAISAVTGYQACTEHNRRLGLRY